MNTAAWTQRWKRLSRRQQLAAFGGASLLLIWVAYQAALRPVGSHLRRLHRDVKDAEARLLEATMAVGQAEAVNRAFQAYAPYVESAGTAESALAGFLGEVETAVQRSGMTVLNLKPLASAARAQTLGVALEGEATPTQLLQCLDLLQRSTRLLRVTELTVRASEAKILRTSLVISKLLLADRYESGAQ